VAKNIGLGWKMNGKGKHSSLLGFGNNYGYKLGICDIEIEQNFHSQMKQNGTKLSVDKKS